MCSSLYLSWSTPKFNYSICFLGSPLMRQWRGKRMRGKIAYHQNLGGSNVKLNPSYKKKVSLCHQHIHYASERRFSCEIDWKSKLKTLYMFICSYTRSPASYIYRYPSFMVWITGPGITSMSQILWEETKHNCLNIWIPRRISCQL